MFIIAAVYGFWYIEAAVRFDGLIDLHCFVVH